MVETSKFDSDEDPPMVYAAALPPASAPYYYNDGNNNHDPSSSSSSAGSAIRTEWNCPNCTLINPIANEYCDACYNCQPNFPESTPTEDNDGTVNVDPHLVVLDDDVNIREPEHEQEEEEEDAYYVEEDPYHKKIRRRCRRKRRMVVGGVAGCVVGSIILCFPIGSILGAVTGAWTARAISKRRERVKDNRLAKERLAATVEQLPMLQQEGGYSKGTRIIKQDK
jgi:ferredoxin